MTRVRKAMPRNAKARATKAAPARRTQHRAIPTAALAAQRLDRLARVTERAEYVLGSREAGLRWLTRANRALAGAVPSRLLDAECGADDVVEVLDRILYGVYT